LQFLELLIFFYAIAINRPQCNTPSMCRRRLSVEYDDATTPSICILTTEDTKGDKPTMTSAHRKNFNRRYLHDKSILEGETTCCNNLHVLID